MVVSEKLVLIADAIQKHEGWLMPSALHPQGSVSFRNNNPGNLVFAHQAGAVLSPDGRFAKFDSYSLGRAALERQIALDAGRGLTLAGFLSKYAPQAENNTAAYIAAVSQATGIGPNDPLAGALLLASAPAAPAQQGFASLFPAFEDSGTLPVVEILVGIAGAAFVYSVAHA